jgi:hypothetical protein
MRAREGSEGAAPLASDGARGWMHDGGIGGEGGGGGGMKGWRYQKEQAC